MFREMNLPPVPLALAPMAPLTPLLTPPPPVMKPNRLTKPETRSRTLEQIRKDCRREEEMRMKREKKKRNSVAQENSVEPWGFVLNRFKTNRNIKLSFMIYLIKLQRK